MPDGQYAGGEIVPSAQRGVLDAPNGSAASRSCARLRRSGNTLQAAMHENNSFLELIMNGDV